MKNWTNTFLQFGQIQFANLIGLQPAKKLSDQQAAGGEEQNATFAKILRGVKTKVNIFRKIPKLRIESSQKIIVKVLISTFEI